MQTLDQWFGKTYDKFSAFDTTSIDTPVAEQVALAMQASEESVTYGQYSDSEVYGFGALAIGAAATVAYLFKKRQQKVTHLAGESANLGEAFVQN